MKNQKKYWLLCSVLVVAGLIGCVKVSDKNPQAKQDGLVKQVSETDPETDSDAGEIQEVIVLSGLIENNDDKDPQFQWHFRAHKIVVEEGTTIRTNGASLLIEASEIEATNWHIETFSTADNQQISQTDRVGRSSGSIEIKALAKATGNWQIFTRGEAGSVGPRGQHATERGDYRYPAVGHQGEAGVIEYIDPWPGQGFPLPHFPRYICGRQAGQGGPGETGMDGLTGGEGYSGGDSGQVIVYLPNDSQAQVIVNRIPGVGGTGGIGGDGGPGGTGGLGGLEAKSESQVICPAGPAGPNGASGKPGPAGKQGKSGSSQVACVQRGDTRVCLEKLN